MFKTCLKFCFNGINENDKQRTVVVGLFKGLNFLVCTGTNGVNEDSLISAATLDGAVDWLGIHVGHVVERVKNSETVFSTQFTMEVLAKVLRKRNRFIRSLQCGDENSIGTIGKPQSQITLNGVKYEHTCCTKATPQGQEPETYTHWFRSSTEQT